MKVYKYEQSFGRMGNLSGVFIAKDRDVAKAMGQEVYLGEVLGKHSEVLATVDETTLRMISDDKNVIAFVKEQLGGGIGTNPVERFLENERGE